MTKDEINKELGDLIYRFKILKKALVEEEQALSPLEKAMRDTAKAFSKPVSTLTREQVLVKARELAEQQHSQRLANQLQKSGMLGSRPPRQPTSEEMSKAATNMWAQQNGFSTQEEMNKAESEWGNGINNWLVEAAKPISQKFKNEQEERAYWDKISVSDSGRGTEGY